MNPQPDQLFRKKLQDHHLPAPPSAWERIENNLSRTKRFIFWRLAAAVLLLIAASWIIFSLRSVPQQSVTEEITTSKKELSLPEQSLTSNPDQDANTNPQQASVLKRQQRPSALTTKVMEETNTASDVPDLETTTTTVVVQDAPKGSTTIITLAEAQQFLKSEISVTDATSGNKKTSRFQKLVGLASVIASEEDVLGQLRERKDELLVRNVRTLRNEQNN